MRTLIVGGIAAGFLVLWSGNVSVQEIDISDTQIQYNRGQNVAPIFEGWVRNPDGTIDFWFGYLNRNWEQVLHIPVGPENSIEPFGPDGGQPTVFVPRRRVGRAVQRRESMVFSVRVPATWTAEDELVWAVTANGKPDRAIALFLPIYELVGPRASNQPPTIEVSAESSKIELSGAATLFSSVNDDGLPHRRRGSANVRWVHYRGEGSVDFSPTQTAFPEGEEVIDDLSLTTTAKFSNAGEFTLRAIAYDGDMSSAENVVVQVTE